MRRQSAHHGLLLLDKAPGVTSFEALARVKRALDTGRVGHCGTLDKFAEGLLLVLVGAATRLVPWFTGCDKRYEAVVLFGEETDTLDPEGEVVGRSSIPSRADVEAVLPAFSGSILQAPPAYSAVHVDGVRAWQRARSGEVLEMAKRPVTVYDISLTRWDPPLAHFSIHCSSGTYIRSLARDMAQAMGLRGRLHSLARESVGAFTRAEALRPARDPLESAGEILKGVYPVDAACLRKAGLPVLVLDEAEEEAVRHGRPCSRRIVEACLSSGCDTALVAPSGRFAAVLRPRLDAVSYACVNGEYS